MKKDKSHVGAHKIKNLSNINFKFNFVKSFHEYKIEFDKSKFIEKLVLAKDKSVECFKIKKDKIAVVIWHPERETTNVKDQFSLNLLFNYKITMQLIILASGRVFD